MREKNVFCVPRELQRLLSLFCLLWAELNGGENSLPWKANMLPLFSILTLWFIYIDTHIYIDNRYITICIFYVLMFDVVTITLRIMCE